MPTALAAGTALARAAAYVSAVMFTLRNVRDILELTVAVAGSVKAHRVESLAPALDGLEVRLPIRLSLAGSVGLVGSHAEALVSASHGSWQEQHSGGQRGERVEKLHDDGNLSNI